MILGTSGSFNDPSLRWRRCPACRGRGPFRRHGSYERWLVTVRKGAVAEELMSVNRVRCPHCGRTHALIPPGVTPYSPYSATFWKVAAAMRRNRGPTVANLCSWLCICPRTLYRRLPPRRAGPADAEGALQHSLSISSRATSDYLAVIGTQPRERSQNGSYRRAESCRARP